MPKNYVALCLDFNAEKLCCVVLFCLALRCVTSRCVKSCYVKVAARHRHCGRALMPKNVLC